MRPDYFGERRGPMAMGAVGLDPRNAGDGMLPMQLGLLAGGLSVGIPAVANRLAWVDQAQRDPELLQSRMLELELQRRLRRQSVEQGGYADGLEIEHQRLMRDMDRYGTYEDQLERQGR